MADYIPVEARSEIINTGGTVIHSGLVPTEPGANDPGTATHYAIFGRGGYKSVPTIADRDELLQYPSRCEEGMLVYVEEDDQIYKLRHGGFIIWKPSTTVLIDSSSLSLPVYRWVAYTNDENKTDGQVYLYPPAGQSFRYIGTAENMSMRRDVMKRYYEKISNNNQEADSITYSQFVQSIAGNLIQWDAINEDIDDTVMPVGEDGQRHAVPAASLFEWTDQVQNGRELNDYMLLVESNKTVLSVDGKLDSTVELTIMHQENDGTYSKVSSIGSDLVLESICTKADGTPAGQASGYPKVSNQNSLFKVISYVPDFGTGGGSAQIEICLTKNQGSAQQYKVGQVIIPIGMMDSSVIGESKKYVDECVEALDSSLRAEIKNLGDEIRALIVDTSSGDYSSIIQRLNSIEATVSALHNYNDEEVRQLISQLRIDLNGIRTLVESLDPSTGEVDFSSILQEIGRIEAMVGQLRIDASGDFNWLNSRITQTAESIEATAREIALSTVQDYVKNLGTDTWLIFADKDPQDPANTDIVYTAQSNAGSKFYGMKFGQTKSIWEKIDVEERPNYVFTADDVSILGIPSGFAWISLGENTNFGIDKTYGYSTLSQIVQWGMNKHLQVNFRYIVHKQTQDGYENVPASQLVGKVTVNYESGRASDTYDMTASGYEIGLLNIDGLKHASNNKYVEFANNDDIVKDVRVNIWTASEYSASSTAGNILSLSVQPTVVSGVIVDISNGLSTVIQDENGHYNELKTSISEHKDWMDAAGLHFTEIDASIRGIRTSVTDLDASVRSTIEQTAGNIRSTIIDLSNGVYSRIQQTADSIQGIAQEVALSTVDERLRSLGTDTWLVFADNDPNDPDLTANYTAQSGVGTKYYGMKFGQSQTVWEKLGKPEQSGYMFTAADCSVLGIPKDFAWISLGDDAMFLSSVYNAKAVSQIVQWSMDMTLQANLRYIVQKQTSDGYENVPASQLVGKVTVYYSKTGKSEETFDMTATGYELSLFSTALKHPSNDQNIRFADKDDQVSHVKIDIWTAAEYAAGTDGNVFSTSVQPTVVSGVIVDISNGLSTVIQDENGHYNELKTATSAHQSWIDREGVHLTQIDASIRGIRTSVTDLDSSVSSRFTQTANQFQTSIRDLSNNVDSRITQTATALRTEFRNSDTSLNSKIEQTASSLRTELTTMLSNGLESVDKETWIIYSAGDPKASGTNYYYNPNVTGLTHVGVRYNQTQTLQQKLNWTKDPATDTAAISSTNKTKLEVPDKFVWSLLKETETPVLGGVYKMSTFSRAVSWDTDAKLRVNLSYLVRKQVAGSSSYEDNVPGSELTATLSVSFKRNGGSEQTDTYTLTTYSTYWLIYWTDKLLHTAASGLNGQAYDFTRDLVTNVSVTIKRKSDNVELFTDSVGTPGVQVGTVQTITQSGITTAIQGLNSRFESLETSDSRTESWKSAADGKFTTLTTGLNGLSLRVDKHDTSLNTLRQSGYFDISAGGISLGVQNTLNGKLSDTGIDITNKKIALRADNVTFSNDVEIRGNIRGPKNSSNEYSYNLQSNGAGSLGYGAIRWDTSSNVSIGSTLQSTIRSAAAAAAQEAVITPKSYVIDCDTPVYTYNPDTNAVRGGGTGKKSITVTMYEVSGGTRSTYPVYWFRNGTSLSSSKKTGHTWDQSINDSNVGGNWDKITITAAANSNGTGVLASYTIYKLAEGAKGDAPDMSEIGNQYAIRFTNGPSLVCNLSGYVTLTFEAQLIRTSQNGTKSVLRDSDGYTMAITYGSTRAEADSAGTYFDDGDAIDGTAIGNLTSLYGAGGVMIYAGKGTMDNVCQYPLASAFIPLTFDSKAALSISDRISAVVRGFCGESFSNWTSSGITSGVKNYITGVNSKISQTAGQITIAVNAANSASNDVSTMRSNLSSTGIDITNKKIQLRANRVTFCDSNGGNTDKIKIDTTTGTLYAKNMTAEGGTFKDITVSGNSTLNNVKVTGSFRGAGASTVSSGTIPETTDMIYLSGSCSLPSGSDQIGRTVTIYAPRGSHSISGGTIWANGISSSSVSISAQFCKFTCISSGVWVLNSWEDYSPAFRYGSDLKVLGIARSTSISSSGVVSFNYQTFDGSSMYIQRTGQGRYTVSWSSSWFSSSSDVMPIVTPNEFYDGGSLNSRAGTPGMARVCGISSTGCTVITGDDDSANDMTFTMMLINVHGLGMFI